MCNTDTIRPFIVAEQSICKQYLLIINIIIIVIMLLSFIAFLQSISFFLFLFLFCSKHIQPCQLSTSFSCSVYDNAPHPTHFKQPNRVNSNYYFFFAKSC